MRKWLKELREGKGITQNDISKKHGITQCTYSLLETGKRQSKMSIETAQKLAAVFDVPIEYVLEQETKVS